MSLEKEVKKQYWEFIVYPESVKENWKDILISQGMKFCISPLHDKDTYDFTDPEIGAVKGQFKKPHYHVLLWFRNPTTWKNVQALRDMIGAGRMEWKYDLKGAYDYLDHSNAPDKAQYSRSDYQHFNDFDINIYIRESEERKIQLKKELREYVKTADIYDYSDLLDRLDEEGLDELADMATKVTIYIKGYIDSRRFKKERLEGKAEEKAKKYEIELQKEKMLNEQTADLLNDEKFLLLMLEKVRKIEQNT